VHEADDDVQFLARYRSTEEQKQKEVNAISQRRWSEVKAIQRYMSLAAQFQAQRFDRVTPLTYYCVPWPILDHPATSKIEDIQETAIKKFYRIFRRNEGDQKYAAALKQARAMFHPDRWDSYQRYEAVADAHMVSGMRAAVLEVSKAVGNLWDSLHE
jgi:hypothetical protein